MNTGEKSAGQRLEAAYKMCPRCGTEAVLSSSAYGLRENVLFVLGASLYRCHECDARHALWGGRIIGLGDPNEDKTPYVVVAAIVCGLFVWVGIALWILRRAHRWPF